MELDSIGRKLIVLDAYIKPFVTIEKAKQVLGKEIIERASQLQEIVEKESDHYNLLEAVKNNNDLEYLRLIKKIKENYDMKDIFSLQKGILSAVEKTAERHNQIPAEEPKQEKQAEPTKKETIVQEETEHKEETKVPPRIEIPPKEKYQELIQKYKNQMYDIRQSIDSCFNSKQKGEKPTNDEMQAFLANLIQDIIVIKKRSNTEKLVKEEKEALKKYIKTAIKNNYSKIILLAYEKELNEIGINPIQIMNESFSI